MDINMKDVMLSKEDDGWIYINEMVNGIKTATTKLLYAPSNCYKISDLEEDFTNLRFC